MVNRYQDFYLSLLKTHGGIISKTFIDDLWTKQRVVLRGLMSVSSHPRIFIMSRSVSFHETHPRTPPASFYATSQPMRPSIQTFYGCIISLNAKTRLCLLCNSHSMIEYVSNNNVNAQDDDDITKDFNYPIVSWSMIGSVMI